MNEIISCQIITRTYPESQWHGFSHAKKMHPMIRMKNPEGKLKGLIA